MMTADELRRMYRDLATQPVTVRRYTGKGVAAPFFDAAVKGRSAAYAPAELVNNVLQRDLRVIVLIEDMIDQGMTLPITESDKIIVAERTNELAVLLVIPRKSSDGTAVAYELQCRG